MGCSCCGKKYAPAARKHAATKAVAPVPQTVQEATIPTQQPVVQPRSYYRPIARIVPAPRTSAVTTQAADPDAQSNNGPGFPEGAI